MVSPSPQFQGNLFARRYVLRKKLGAGSLGSVYLAFDVEGKRQVALKVIHAERLGPAAIARMKDEFRAIASLDHPQIAKAYDFGYTEPDGVPFYTREYIQGMPLPPGPPGREPPSRFLRPILDLLDALDYVHEQGILHLDVHAGNLIVADARERGAVLIDIGVRGPLGGARLTTTPEEWTSLPPEIPRHGTVSPRTDIFLAGRLLQFRLTGRMSGSPDLPKEIPGWGTRLTLNVERIISKALQDSPENRFASASELREALFQALGEGNTRASAREPHGVTVGRDDVLAEVEDGLRRVAAGEGVVLWLTGKAGWGKTHVLAQARLAAQLRGLRTLEIHFASGGDRVGVFAEADGPHRRAGSDLDSWHEPLNPRHGGTPSERAQRAAEACFAESGPPLVFLLDDYDQAKTESRILVEALMAECALRKKSGQGRRGVGLFLSVSRRPRRRSASWQVLRLSPLRHAEARDLALSLLKPLVPPSQVLKRIVARGGGIPLHLRRISRALHQEWARSGAIPRAAEVPDCPVASSALGRGGWAILPTREREVLEALAILERPASRDELRAALDRDEGPLSQELRKLLELELVTAEGQGRTRRFQLSAPDEHEQLLQRTARSKVRRIHLKMANLLKGSSHPGPRDLENLTRHLLALGRSREAYAPALEAAKLFRASGSFDRAVRLLEDCSSSEEDPSVRLRLAEEMSDLLDEAGDHERGISALERLIVEKKLPEKDRIRLQRRLGIHCHRAGYPDRAERLFEDAIRKADARANAEDLIFMDTELAELHLFRGILVKAEEACRRGLERLRGLTGSSPFKGRMEVLLRASLGHIEMRRMDLGTARMELERALPLAKKHSPTGERATILHNLAIVENQLNDFTAARRHFREAERMLLAAGESRNVIKIATNLAVIAAKLGDAEGARRELDRASRLLQRYPGRQFEFFLTYSQGVVALLTGRCEAAMASLESCLLLGRQLGDAHLTGFAGIYLAEAQILCGRYQKARNRLRLAAKKTREQTLHARMAHARLQLVEALLGNETLARRSRRMLESIPQTNLELLEAWNELFLGLGEMVSGEARDSRFAGALEVFRRLGVPFGARFSRLALLLSAMACRDTSMLAGLLAGTPQETAEKEQRPHSFLDVAEALLRAAAHLELGQAESAEEWVSRASSAIIGSPFLELDWSIECLRAQLALRRREGAEARRHLHRSLHTRDLLLQMVPPKCREGFLSHARFLPLNEARARLQGSPLKVGSTASLWDTSSFEGMVGRSREMLRVFQAIERFKDQDLPVLIIGETGTGKELVARAIFRRSSRHGGPFLPIHCASIPEELFEAELFGCAAGSYTGADEDRPGILESLQGGTALFDDLDCLSLRSQAKLLQAIDSSTARRVGGTAPVHLDVRFLFSTSTDLAEAVADGRFRKDLYFRVHGLEITLPPLRARKEDIPLLARHFIEQHAARLERPAPSMDEAALELLKQRSWPGNVRELESLLLRALVNLSPGASLGAGLLRSLLGAASRAFSVPPRDLLAKDLGDLRADLEREYLTQLFLTLEGSPKAMMERLGVGRTRLYAWFRQLRIDVKALRERLEPPP